MTELRWFLRMVTVTRVIWQGAVGEHFMANLNFLPKKQSVQFRAAGLLAYEHLKVNVQLPDREPENRAY